MDTSLFTELLEVTNGPWRVKDENRGIVVDAQDRRICTIPKAGEIGFDERVANQAAIAAAPELLGALRMTAWVLTTMGCELKPEFYSLINRASVGAPELVPESVRLAGVDAIVSSVEHGASGPSGNVLAQVEDPD